jgi:hypothetical protein
MRKSLLPLFLAGTVALGGCAYGLPGMGGPAILSSVLGSALPANSSAFQRDAVNACGSHAQRYGRAQVTELVRISSSTLGVAGVIDTNDFRRRTFTCDFRSDGRITDFDID